MLKGGGGPNPAYAAAVRAASYKMPVASCSGSPCITLMASAAAAAVGDWTSLLVFILLSLQARLQLLMTLASGNGVWITHSGVMLLCHRQVMAALLFVTSGLMLSLLVAV